MIFSTTEYYEGPFLIFAATFFFVLLDRFKAS